MCECVYVCVSVCECVYVEPEREVIKQFTFVSFYLNNLFTWFQ